MLTAPKDRERVLADQLKNFLRTIVAAIARSTPTPEILHYPNDALIEFAVDPKDQGRFIGKHGTTIWAIQTLFWFAGLAQFGYSYSIKLTCTPIEQRPSMPIKFSPLWPRKTINNLISEIIAACVPEHADYSVDENGETKALVTLTLPKYLELQLSDPSFPEAFATVVRTAGISNGVSLRTETHFA